MRPQRAAPVQTGVQQHHLPEVAPHRQVYGEVYSGDVEEDRVEKLVGEHAPVEFDRQLRDVLPVADVRRCLVHDAVPATSTTPRTGSSTTLIPSSAT